MLAVVESLERCFREASFIGANGIMSHLIGTWSSQRLWLLGAACLVATGFLGVQFVRAPQLLGRLQMYDFVEYWAAGRLIASGENPYDLNRMHELEREAGRSEDGILMWNPPWTLPLVLPFGALPVRVAHVLWLALQLSVLVYCADRLWILYSGDRELRWVSWLLGVAFLPSLFAVTAGQITPLLLLGVVGFLSFLERKRETWAGVAAVLIAVKPHLAYLFWLALLLWSIRERRWRTLAGGILTGMAMTALPLLFDAHVLQEYWQTFTQKPPAQYRSPTLGTVLRLAFGEEQFRLQFVALIPGLLWFAPYWWMQRHEWKWKEQLPLLLTVSVLTTAYGGWPFDLVLLLLPILHAAALAVRGGWNRTTSLAAGLFLAVNALAFVQLMLQIEYFWFLWITPAVLAAYLAVYWTATRLTPAETTVVECAGN
jgi:Glycosyltransferase family 87